jgi:hypothetical protein
VISKKNSDELIVVTVGLVLSAALLCDTGGSEVADASVLSITIASNGFSAFPKFKMWVGDLRNITDCRPASRDASYVFNLAADTGGIGFIENHS